MKSYTSSKKKKSNALASELAVYEGLVDFNFALENGLNELGSGVLNRYLDRANRQLRKGTSGSLKQQVVKRQRRLIGIKRANTKLNAADDHPEGTQHSEDTKVVIKVKTDKKKKKIKIKNQEPDSPEDTQHSEEADIKKKIKIEKKIKIKANQESDSPDGKDCKAASGSWS